MVRFADPEVLQRVSEADRKLISNWQEGLSLESRSGRRLDELLERAVFDRFSLASDCLRRARRLQQGDGPLYRDAVSRFYYAAYHAMRAVVFYATSGDDHQEHSVLPLNLPSNFPNQAEWKNDLKTARLIRNSADYDLYPKTDSAWRVDCDSVRDIAERAVRDSRIYLRREGCRYI